MSEIMVEPEDGFATYIVRDSFGRVAGKLEVISLSSVEIQSHKGYAFTPVRGWSGGARILAAISQKLDELNDKAGL